MTSEAIIISMFNTSCMHQDKALYTVRSRLSFWLLDGPFAIMLSG